MDSLLLLFDIISNFITICTVFRSQPALFTFQRKMCVYSYNPNHMRIAVCMWLELCLIIYCLLVVI